MNYFLAIDIGASSGRHILGHVEDGKIVLDREDPIVASSLTTINKEIVHAGAKKAGL